MGNFKKIDWLNHFLEFIVVIIGILIAFQLNTCSQQKKEQKLITEHIENVIEETLFNQQGIQVSIEDAHNSLTKIDTLLNYIVARRNLDSINKYSLEMLNLGGAYFKNKAYNSLIESGDIRLVKDFSLKDDIISLYEYYKWTEGFDKMNNESYLSFFYPYMVENMDLIQGSTQEPSVYFTKKFNNSLAVYRYQLAARLNKYEETLKRINTFLKDHNE